MTSYKEIQEQIARLQEEAAIAHKIEIKEAVASIREKMELYGITLADLNFGPEKQTQAKRIVVEAKFRDPSTGKTWAGRGRVPLWLIGDREHYRI